MLVLQLKHKFILVFIIYVLNTTRVLAMDSYGQGDGNVSLRGSVVETACGIAVESLYQTIDMDVVSIGEVIRNGHGKRKRIDIKLENCILPSDTQSGEGMRKFAVTFDGDSHNGLFVVHGDAKGVSLIINDAQGHIIRPGKLLPSEEILQQNRTLNYYITLVSNSESLKSGLYYSTIRYKLDYH
ncbi:type 1 fimbrial protein [Citrobacter portucalensis]|uniref:Type 1 fimbrial protein n=1 Tax=Citrobacter portucalensis TaxID=1639133 RepID=A0AAW5WGK0_9ENTR|nr:fimbrial protein [Citrobacter portucalensis]MCX9004739.1 type 1 fimbrial protein [Citrobacter portucalensis]